MAEPPAVAAALSPADASELVQRAWELCYLDPRAAAELGGQIAASGGPHQAAGWLHVALVEVRIGDVELARHALEQARALYAAVDDQRGLALCDEAQAIALRRAGEFQAAADLLEALDARLLRGGFSCDAMHRFIGHNSRAITAKLLGQTDAALRHFYAARDAAQATGWAGPRITALSNLGGYHHDLFNLEDARRVSAEALAAAQEAGAHQTIFNSACNLIVIHYAGGDMQQARAMAEFMLEQTQSMAPGAAARYALPLALGHLAVGDIDAALTFLKPGATSPVADGDGMTFWAWLMGRCLLSRGDPARARSIAERTLRQRRQACLSDQPYDLMALYRVLADACEEAGDAIAALTYMREAHALYEELVGRSARARFTALEISHQLAKAQRERDLAVDLHRTVEDDHRRLAELNTALQAKMAETEMLHTQLREQAVRDPLTGLHNRRYLFEMAPGLLELARRQGKPLCVVLMDLDHFKLLNDTFGHAAGDLVLQRFSALLMQMLRRSDVVCRHGGEEFVAVMPDIDAAGAQAMLVRLLEAYQDLQHTMGTRRLPRGSFSAGIALFPSQGSTLEHLLSRADRGLYAAKNQGRARIEMAPGTGFGALG